MAGSGRIGAAGIDHFCHCEGIHARGNPFSYFGEYGFPRQCAHWLGMTEGGDADSHGRYCSLGMTGEWESPHTRPFRPRSPLGEGFGDADSHVGALPLLGMTWRLDGGQR